MELAATFLLFATVAAVFTFALSKFWAKPKSAIERVTRASAEAQARPAPHPSLVFRDLVTRLGNLLPRSPADVTVMERKLIRAGFRGPGALKAFYGAKVALAAVMLLASAVLTVRSASSAEQKFMGIAAGGAMGFILPNQFVNWAGKRRRKQIRKALPNALDLLVVCVESGLGLDQAIMQAAKELEHAHPQISQEFALVNLELRAGSRRVEALRNLADRTAVADLKKLVAVLIQADRFGTGVAQSLRAHSEYMRVQARQAAEEKAAKLGVKLIFPIFFCILPSLFVVTVGPVMVRISRELLPMMRNI